MGIPLIALLCLFFFAKRSFCDPRATEAALLCSNATAETSVRQAFVANFLAAMDALSRQVSTRGYGSTVNGSGSNVTVYGFGECMRDLSHTDCDLCFAQIKTQILRCLPFQRLIRGGRLFYDGCYLRYDDYMFLNESLSSVDEEVCGQDDFGGNETVFKHNVVDLVKNLSLDGQRRGGFSVGSVNRWNVSVYGLAQCWEFVNGSGCGACFADAVSRIQSCIPKKEGRVLNAGCYLRYSTQKFYYNSSKTDLALGDEGGSHLVVILASTLASVASVLIIATISFIVWSKVRKNKTERKQLGDLLATVNKSKLNFPYETLEKATNYFHLSNKLGQGGSGSVYKGTLPDGKVVAIKRLFFNTRQWVDHFFNEVNLISGIHHKNLVQLLGCSITGPESLLVYEFVPNCSLSDHLFVRSAVEPLNWEARSKIILGTAEGLAYLHEELEFRIVHRDIKLSNVLLNEDFTPKIADFGLARLFPKDQTHISTAIAGTLGYMAPEYVVRGKLTEKADVYSFGVLVIEVVSGKNCNSFSQNSYSILQMAWNLYQRGRLHAAVDEALDGKFEEEEACRLLQIGLLCVQASAELRPSMSMVVKMIKGNDEIPVPTQPPFLNSCSAEISRSKKSENSHSGAHTGSSLNSMTESLIEPR
ncbi:Non-specific serine/threonine protein kinase [Bertholletia excelsa]